MTIWQTLLVVLYLIIMMHSSYLAVIVPTCTLLTASQLEDLGSLKRTGQLPIWNMTPEGTSLIKYRVICACKPVVRLYESCWEMYRYIALMPWCIDFKAMHNCLNMKLIKTISQFVSYKIPGKRILRRFCNLHSEICCLAPLTQQQPKPESGHYECSVTTLPKLSLPHEKH